MKRQCQAERLVGEIHISTPRLVFSASAKPFREDRVQEEPAPSFSLKAATQQREVDAVLMPTSCRTYATDKCIWCR